MRNKFTNGWWIEWWIRRWRSGNTGSRFFRQPRRCNRPLSRRRESGRRREQRDSRECGNRRNGNNYAGTTPETGEPVHLETVGTAAEVSMASALQDSADRQSSVQGQVERTRAAAEPAKSRGGPGGNGGPGYASLVWTASSSVVQRKTLSPLGTRVGTRQHRHRIRGA